MVVRDLILGMWSGVSLSVATVCHDAGRSLGLGMSIGAALAQVLSAAVWRVDKLRHVGGSTLPPAAAAAQYFGPSHALSTATWVVGRAVGVLVAFRMQTLALTLGASTLSAHALLMGLGQGGAARHATWLLAALGLYAQRRYELPLALRVLLAPAYLLEASLRGVALKLTNDDFTRARAKARVN
eukprot:scaffold118235_cov69-Phaeocystis_antarctica.AAC.4